jgi:hypothetical protein
MYRPSVVYSFECHFLAFATVCLEYWKQVFGSWQNCCKHKVMPHLSNGVTILLDLEGINPITIYGDLFVIICMPQ